MIMPILTLITTEGATQMHTRNKNLRNHRGFSMALPNGLSVAYSTIISMFNGTFQRIVTHPPEVVLDTWFPLKKTTAGPGNLIKYTQN